MNDLIRKKDAIDAIEGITSGMSICVNSDECHGMKRMQRQAVLEIANMPSAEPERKRGRWIFKAEEFYKAVNEKGGGVNENTPFFTDDIACSECLSMFSVIDNEAERFNFCPSCGADMRGNDGKTENN